MDLSKQKVNSKFIDLQKKAKDQKASQIQTRPLFRNNVETRNIKNDLSIDISNDDDKPL